MRGRRADTSDNKTSMPVRRTATRNRRPTSPAPPVRREADRTVLTASPTGAEAATPDQLDALRQDEILAFYARTGYSLDHHAAHLIRRAHQRASAAFGEVLGGDDLTPTQFAVLAVVLKHEALSQNHLGRLTAMDPSTVSVVVRVLVKRGLAVRGPSETDQRMALIRLTNAGIRYALERLDGSMEVARRVLQPLSPAEQATFLELLKRVADAAGD